MRQLTKRVTKGALALALAGMMVPLLGVTAAQAAAPTITSFTPTTGPVGTSVTITGTGFMDGSTVTGVTFNTTAATTFTVNSDTSITATVPTGATTGPIRATDSEGTSAPSATSFTVTPSTGPTITSFTPTSGEVGTSVVITGTGFTGATAVSFGGTAATTFTVNSATQITATVPTGATTGPIAVTTPGGTGTSATSFTVGPSVTTHNRSVSLSLRRHLIARGRVNAADGFSGCESGVMVKIQRRKGGSWRTVGSDLTTGTGRYREPIADKNGRYRALVAKASLGGGDDICRRAVSAIQIHH